jgi:hypothetical protein
MICVLLSVKNEYVDNNSITEQTGLQSFLFIIVKRVSERKREKKINKLPFIVLE